jgi:hypothetical protein
MEKCLCGRWFKSRRAMFGNVGSCNEYAAFKEWMDDYKAANSAEELLRWSERAGKMVPWGWKDYYTRYVEMYGYNRLEREKSRSQTKAVHESSDAKKKIKALEVENNALYEDISFLSQQFHEEVDDTLQMKRELLQFLQPRLIPSFLQEVTQIFLRHGERSSRREAERKKRVL